MIVLKILVVCTCVPTNLLISLYVSRRISGLQFIGTIFENVLNFCKLFQITIVPSPCYQEALLLVCPCRT